MIPIGLKIQLPGNLHLISKWKRMPDSTALPLVALTGSQRPYIFDLSHLLSLPNGFEFRFRYRYRWVEDEILTSVATDPSSLVGQPIVILFHSQERKRIVPIRKGTVLGVESVGPMIFLRFRVGEFPKTALDIQAYSHPGSERDVSAAERLAVLGREQLGKVGDGEPIDLSLPLPPGCYLRRARHRLSNESWDTHDHAAAWARLVAVLQSEPGLTGIPFFYLLGFRTEAGASVRPSAVKNRFSVTREEIYGFSLVESERYRMRVAEWSEPPKDVEQPPVKVNCEFNSTLLALEGSSNLVVGRYDVIEFTFSALQAGYSEIALRAEPLQKSPATPSKTGAHVGIQHGSGALAWADWPAIFVARVPVVVKPKARRLLVPAISLGVGFGLYLFAAPRETNETWRRAIEVVSVGFLFFGYRAIIEHLEGLFKLSAGMKKLRGGPEEWIGGDKS